MTKLVQVLLSDVSHPLFCFSKGHHLSMDPVQTTAALKFFRYIYFFMAVSHNNKFPSCSTSFSLTARAEHYLN